MLKLLLKELIDKSLQQDRNNSKILLRSNASVAEKMLANWFAFLLFGYIKVRGFDQKSSIPYQCFFFDRIVSVLLSTSYFNRWNSKFRKVPSIVSQANRDIRWVKINFFDNMLIISPWWEFLFSFKTPMAARSSSCLQIVYAIQTEEEKALHLPTPVPIKVLSCDSITQVKEKIVDHFYKTIPFSKRPPIDGFDLGTEGNDSSWIR